jgi:hypothetical protein
MLRLARRIGLLRLDLSCGSVRPLTLRVPLPVLKT